MEVRQRTIEEMVETEKQMVLQGEARYGAYFAHARDSTIVLSNFVKEADRSRWIFVSFLSQVKKHHTLALFSALRLHRVQSAMCLRLVLESGALAAVAIANPEHTHFLVTNDAGYLDQSKKLTAKAYSWLDVNYPDGSKTIKDIKEQINAASAHANLVNTISNTEMREHEVLSPFFDIEDEFHVKTDLWRIGNIAIGLLDLFYGVNSASKAIRFVDDFVPRFQELDSQSKALHAEMTATERFKQAEIIMAQRVPARPS